MKPSNQNPQQAHYFSVRISVFVALLLVFVSLSGASASATYEQVGTFAANVTQLRYASGMAVNSSGAGGVPVGTVYAVGEYPRVIRYSARGEFRAAWGWNVGNDSEEFQRCGPDGDPAFPTCEQERVGSSGEGAGEFSRLKGIAVDESTGNVYVLNAKRQHGVVEVFSADGSELIASFGEMGAPGETIEEGPERIHENISHDALAVDDSGTVYVSDLTSGFEGRVMRFNPESPADYEHYVYAGRSQDIASSNNGIYSRPEYPSVDSAGNLYVAIGSGISKFATSEPSAPVCEYTLPGGGVTSIAVNPTSGEIFFSSEKDGKIHQLSVCVPKEGFDDSAITLTPRPSRTTSEGITALAFDPTTAYAATRSAGILYAADGYEEGPIPRRYSLGYMLAPPEPHSPRVESESVFSVTSSAAAVKTQINPSGSSTRYVVQYISKEAYEANDPADRFAGASESPVGGGLLGGGQEALSVTAWLVGLHPDTEYHYRAFASSHCEPETEVPCVSTGADQTFRTFPVEAPGLADGRAYELVSPTQKHGGQVIPAEPEISSCGSGGCKPGDVAPRFPMQSTPGGDAVVYQGFPFSFTEGARVFNEYIAKRTSAGWQTTTLSPPLLGDNVAGAGFKAFDSELTRGLIYQVSPTLSPDGPGEYANLYSQSTVAPSPLTPLVKVGPPNRPAGRSFSLTYAGASRDFSRLFFEANDALTDETPFAPKAVDAGEKTNNLYESVGDNLRLVNVAPGNTETVLGAAFGSRPEGQYSNADLSHAISIDGSRVFWSNEAGQVFVRENGESTQLIPDPGKFLSASADGSRVLLKNGHLYELEAKETNDLTEGNGGFQGIIGQSEDLSRIYFVDTAVLTGGEENKYGAKAQAGEDNLYAWHEGASAFVASLLPSDELFDSLYAGDWKASPSQRTAEASPDGRWVAFLSRTPLTDYDNTGLCGSKEGIEKLPSSCPEVFLFDSASGTVICASCNPSGQRPLGPSHLRRIQFAEDSLPQPRYLTNSGRLYFDTRDSLTPFDTNNGVEDVYQYEPEGIGSCKREAGCVSLISAGHEPVDSNFLAADSTGKNVFFTSRDQLVQKDRDDLIDLYDAREGGGIASETETSRGECQGEACQAAIVAPNDPTPGSSTFEGAGNVDEKKATKKHKKKHKHAKELKSHKRSHGRATHHNRGGAK